MNLYRANGMGIGGFLSRPENVIVEPQASCSLPIVGGYVKSRVDSFLIEGILSFRSAYTRTSGSFDEMHKTHVSSVSSVVEKLNIADIVTADRVVSRMTCSSPANDDDAESSISIIGSYIEGLRIMGFPVMVMFAHELLQDYSSYSQLEKAIQSDKTAHWLPSGVRKISDGYWGSAVRRVILPEEEELKGLKVVLRTVIVIPDFGVLRLAEMLIERSSRQLTMLQVELGSPIKGRLVVCSVDAGSKRDPFTRPDLPQETGQKGRSTDARGWQLQHADALLDLDSRRVARPSERSASAAADERYANVCFTSGQNHVPVPLSHNLKKGARYHLRFDIGTLSPDSAVENAKEYPFPASLLPETTGHWLEVVVASNDFTLSRNRYNLFLPEVGPSWVCSCVPHSKHVCEESERAPYLFIPLTAPTKLYVQTEAGQKRKQDSRKAQFPLATLRLAVYYRKNLVQSQLLNAGVTQLSREGYGYRSKIDYTLAPGFRDVDSLPARTLNILTNRNSDGSHRLVVNGKQDQAMTFNLSEGQMRTAVNSVRDALRNMHVKGNPPNLKNLYDDNNAKSVGDFVKDLRQLAPTGWLLFSTLLQDKPKLRRRLLDELRENRASIQISRVGGSNFLYPWASVYDIGLESSSSAHVPCRLLKEWSSSAKLLEDSTSRCPFEKEHATNTLCPFGFWGFSHSIEVPPSMSEADRVLPQEIPVASAAPQIVIGLSLDLDKKLTKAHLEAIEEQLAGNLIVPKNSRATIHEALNNPKLEVVYFYCHGSRTVLPNNQGDVPSLKVGKNESISPSDITAWDEDWSKIPNHWEVTSPLVFINGCHTAELKPELLVNFVDTFAGVYAAGVIGTEVLVHQQLANEVALEFLKRFVKHKTVGRSISEMRLHFLRKGNLFGLAYTPYCSAELALAPRKSY